LQAGQTLRPPGFFYAGKRDRLLQLPLVFFFRVLYHIGMKMGARYGSPAEDVYE
jgi:hypothetical protein